MSTILEKAQKHFAEQIDETQLQSYYVKEWDDTIYFRSAMNWKEQSQILDLTTSGKTSEALIKTVLLRALDKNGKKLFGSADRVILENDVDPNVIVSIVSAMNAYTIAPTQGEVEKK